MTIIQSEWAKGRKSAPTSRESRGVVAERFTFEVTDNIGTGDILELAILPAYHFVVGATVIPEGDFGEVTADIGIMSGAVGDQDNTRTSGNEIFEAVALGEVSSADKVEGLMLVPADADRSIGVKFSAAVTAGQKLTLLLLTAQ